MKRDEKIGRFNKQKRYNYTTTYTSNAKLILESMIIYGAFIFQFFLFLLFFIASLTYEFVQQQKKTSCIRFTYYYVHILKLVSHGSDY